MSDDEEASQSSDGLPDMHEAVFGRVRDAQAAQRTLETQEEARQRYDSRAEFVQAVHNPVPPPAARVPYWLFRVLELSENEMLGEAEIQRRYHDYLAAVGGDLPDGPEEDDAWGEYDYDDDDAFDPAPPAGAAQWEH